MSRICACLLVVGGAAKVAAQPAFLPSAPPGQPADPKLNTLPTAATGQNPAANPALSAPRPLAPFGPGQVRLPRMPGDPGVIGATPKPSAETIKDYQVYVKKAVRPENVLDVVRGQTHLMILQDVPKRIQIGDESVAAYTLISPTEISILGRDVGSTVLNLWFTDAKDKSKEKILSYLVRVLPDPEYQERLERAYKALEVKLAGLFPDSRICLTVCGEKLLVCGQAKDIAEANFIMELVRSGVPGGGFRKTALQRNADLPLDRMDRGTDPGDLRDGAYPAGTTDYAIGGDSYVVNMLRVAGEQQVSLMVTVVEVNRAAARAIGVNFNLFNNRGIQYFANQTGQIVPNIGNRVFNAANPGALLNGGLQGNFNNLPVALDNGQIQLAISALRELSYARVMVEPNLVTMNGQTANLQVGSLFAVPFVTGTNNGTLESTGYVPIGVQLTFTPFITDKDRIRLQIAAEVSDRDLNLGTTIIGNSVVPNLTTRNFQTVVELREGQTLAVAGLIQNKLGAQSSRVPGFGDLPFIGRLFSFDHIAAEESELVVLVTPELVHPMERKNVPALPGCDIFEPGDLEFYLLGRLESRRSYDYRSPVMTDIARMCRYHKAEQIYIAGPHGHSMTDGMGLPDLHDELPVPQSAHPIVKDPPPAPGQALPMPKKLPSTTTDNNNK